MNNKVKLSCIAILLAPSIAFGADLNKGLHKDVGSAMSYALPEIKCNKPGLPGKGKDVVDATGAVNRDDIDSYTLGRYQRAEKRWMACTTKYKEGLMDDFGYLKDSASHGLTDAQAKIILSNMAKIQAALESPDGIPATELKNK